MDSKRADEKTHFSLQVTISQLNVIGDLLLGLNVILP